MRTAKDRVRHAILFEVIGMALAIPLGTWVFATPVQAIGVVAVVGATIATLWNYIYNLGFDHAMLRLRGDVHKSVPIRVLHAVLFEVGLLLVLLPFIAWYLELSLLYALQMDIAFAMFYVVYAFLFNWGYDWVFPIPIEPVNSGQV